MSLGRCPKCKREWNGTQQAHCAFCCLHFGGDTAFALHRTGTFNDRRCMTLAELTEPRETRRQGPKSPLLIAVESNGATMLIREYRLGGKAGLVGSVRTT